MQQNLFAEVVPIRSPKQARAGLHHSNASQTELAGALANPIKKGTQREKILLAIAKAGFQGLTADEIVEQTETLLQSVCARRKELETAGYIQQTSRTRNGWSGLAQVVWIATDRGFRYARGAS